MGRFLNPIGVSTLRVLTLGLLLVALFCSAATADRVALLPLADLSNGKNGVSLEMTEDLRAELLQRGMQLVNSEDVLHFLEENRVRFLGALDSFLVRKIGLALDCSLVLVGTITEIEEGKNPALAITLSALNTNSGLPVWASTRSVSLAGNYKLLGIGEPRSLTDLKTKLFNQLFSDMNSQMAVVQSDVVRGYQIVSMEMTPGVVRGATWTDCYLRINFLEKAPCRIFIATAGQLRQLEDCGKGHLYRGRVRAPEADGTYPVDLLFEWNEDGERESLENIASVEVINQSPDFSMAVKKGKQMGDVIAFRDHLLLIPQIQSKHPVQRWTLEIIDDSGVSRVYEEHEGAMPDKMVWDGRDGQRRQLIDGFYDLKFEVWDRAGNLANIEKKVAIQTAAPDIDISSIQRTAGNYLILKPKGQKIASFEDWEITVKSPDGKVLLQQQGKGLPAELELPHIIGKDFSCDFEAVDCLGNRSRLANVSVQLSDPDEMIAKEHHSGSWLEDF